MIWNILMWAAIYFWGGWGLYVLVMAIMRMHLAKKLRWQQYLLAAPFAIGGLLLDYLGNWTVCCVVFLDIPRELTISRRLKRYMKQGSGWRYQVAQWICTHALDPFDAKDGDHC